MVQESRGAPRREQFKARMVEQLGAEGAAKLEEALKVPETGRRSLRLNPLKKATRKDFEREGFEFLGPIDWEPQGYWVRVPATGLDSSPALGAGLGYLQEAGAMEVVSQLAPEPGDLVLDLCAAPGGKSTQILERLGSEGWLVCNDPVRARAERLNGLTARHGSARVSVLSQDPDSLVERFADVFDKVLVDAPCSGESFFAKREDKRLDVPDAEVAGCARRQFLILDRASKMLRPGGRLLYSTCTYSKAENAELVRSFLEAHSEFVLEREQYRFPHVDGVPGGYWAKLRRDSSASAHRVHAELSTVSGLLRQGVVKWDGEVDLYALSMLADEMSSSEFERILKYPIEAEGDPETSFPAGFVELSESDARLFLSGQALRLEHPKGFCVLRFNGFAIGYGKSTGDRINNLVPKILRAQR